MPCALADEGFPTVVLGDHFDHPNLAFAYNESKKASLEGMEHLISLGHKRIAFAANDIDDGDHLDRFEAYREALTPTACSKSGSSSGFPRYAAMGLN